MPETIMPAFDRFVEEGNIIGRLLAGYGELELEMCDCVAATTNDLNAAIKMLFGIRSASKRIKNADSMVKDLYTSANFGSKYKETMENMNWCREIRNQYAHCHWYDTSAEGLCFIDLEHVAQLETNIVSVTTHRFPIDTALLRQQEAYFRYVQKCFWYLKESYKSFKGEQGYGGPLFTWPARIKRPLKHN